jgi:hypothetical protein
MQIDYKWLLAAALGLTSILQAPSAHAQTSYEYSYSSFFDLRNRGSYLCVDVEANGLHNGARIQQWGCNGGGAQMFRFAHVWRNSWGWRTYLGFRLQNAQSNKCLDVPWGNAYNGAIVQQWDCNISAAQLWTRKWTNGAQMCTDNWCSYRLQNTTYCLDVPNGSTRWGTKLQIYDCNGTNAQRFD